MSTQDTFTTRLRRHRERNGISLAAIAAETCIQIELLEGLEANDLSRWPRGLYARAFIRAYAGAVGLDPIDTVDEFCRLFPQGDRRAQPTLQDIAAIIAQPSGLQPDLGGATTVDRRTPQMNMLRPQTRSEAALQALKAGAAALMASIARWRAALAPRSTQRATR